MKLRIVSSVAWSSTSCCLRAVNSACAPRRSTAEGLHRDFGASRTISRAIASESTPNVVPARQRTPASSAAASSAIRKSKTMNKTKTSNMNEVAPALFLAALEGVSDQNLVEKHRIRAMLSLGVTPSRVPDGCARLFVDLLDDPREDALRHVPVMFRFLSEHHRTDLSVAVHCRFGQSRSVFATCGSLPGAACQGQRSDHGVRGPQRG